MSILIKGMEMPEFGEKIIILTSSGYAEDVSGQVIAGVEAVPVPPHGRLGDLDAIRADIDEKRPGRSYEDAWALTVIDAAPTIIPADDEHTMEEFMYGQEGNPNDGSL